jgi:hypothetical protein
MTLLRRVGKQKGESYIGEGRRAPTTIYLDYEGSKPGPHVGRPQQHDIDDVPSATRSTNVDNVITTQALRLL